MQPQEPADAFCFSELKFMVFLTSMLPLLAETSNTGQLVLLILDTPTFFVMSEDKSMINIRPLKAMS